MADLYKIKTARGGRFTAFERDDGRWEIDRPGRNETFELSRDRSTFSITERDDGITKKDIYTDRNKDGIFEFQRTEVLDRRPGSRDESYRVDRVTGGRLNVFEWDDGRWQRERPDRNERFRLSRDGKTFTRLEFERKGTEINIYKDGDGDGVFDFVSTRLEPSGAGPRQRRSAFAADADILTAAIDPVI
jgi:hypothetical protein